MVKKSRTVAKSTLVPEGEDDDFSNIALPNLARLPGLPTVHVVMPDCEDARKAVCKRFRRNLEPQEWTTVVEEDLCGRCLEKISERTAEALRGFCS